MRFWFERFYTLLNDLFHFYTTLCTFIQPWTLLYDLMPNPNFHFYNAFLTGITGMKIWVWAQLRRMQFYGVTLYNFIRSFFMQCLLLYDPEHSYGHFQSFLEYIRWSARFIIT